MSSRTNISTRLVGFIIFLSLTMPFGVWSFAFSGIHLPSKVSDGRSQFIKNQPIHRFDDYALVSTRQSSKLYMSNDEGPGGSGGVGIIAGVLLLIFAAGSVLPFVGSIDLATKTGGMSIADSVVTRQDAPGKLKTVENKNFILSRSAIQEKLNSVPVFYISTSGTDGTPSMGSDIYLSFEDAKAASAGISSSTVKGTTLDQVMYPLVLKRGRMRMAPPPTEVEKAEAQITDAGKSNTPAYRLIPSKVAVQQAKELNMELSNSDIPLFIADRLAFGGPKGPQLPLFLDKNDCITSYKRLRSEKSSLPEEPNIRTSSLLQTLLSMERGTRPGVSQLAFYATADDLLRLTEMLSR